MTGTDLIVADGSPDEAVMPDGDTESARAEAQQRPSPSRFLRVLSLWLIPVATMILALGAGYLKYEVGVANRTDRAAAESVQAAKDGTVAILSYTPETAEATLGAARDRLTGTFRDSYSSLTHDVVIPGAKQRSISATATVADAAVVSASVNHALVLVFVNQAITMGTDPPSSSNSVVEVSLDRSGDRWLISGFDPK
ncbi:hypothetical protein M1247_33890 [Mycobacterium sp. 21AC1]|uniref:hypothetical protein n=1 Tax=[Mycobacterium] appelbergii TaxID=2939269 RepID=UPI002938DD6F|nr:hypothetical protein [Mycobacterium sp. 21AC1]MDV3129937.1 hypothetical protein [Mycobacterium sp. 21AC1]